MMTWQVALLSIKIKLGENKTTLELLKNFDAKCFRFFYFLTPLLGLSS